MSFLTPVEVTALISAPDRSRWVGRRDHALLLVAIQTGLRVSELTSLTCRDVHLGAGAHVRCLGKGRKQRSTPLTRQTITTLRAWLRERGNTPTGPLFPTSRGRPLSRDAVALIVARHATTAQQTCPTLKVKIVTPHVLRHTTAMRLLQAGTDTSTIALWLGHEHTETTQIYVHADQTLKEQALGPNHTRRHGHRTVPPIGRTPHVPRDPRLDDMSPRIMPRNSSRSPPPTSTSAQSSA